jgi:putative transcriptional regulator
MNSLEGKFLVASPYLDDPNFSRSVVLIVKHDADEAFGLIVNRPTKLRLIDLVESEDGPIENPNVLVYRGGPVNGSLMALHEHSDSDIDDDVSGLAVTIDKETILALSKNFHLPLRVFYGYAGWGPGQLDAELESGGWLIATATRERIFSETDHLWDELVVEIGRDIIATGIPSHCLPPDPLAN